MQEFITDNNTVANGTSSNDTFYVGAYDYPVHDVTVNAAAGNDTVYNQDGTGVYIDLGVGNDHAYLYDGSSKSTIATGTGNDTVTIFSTDTTVVFAGAGSNLINVCADTGLVIRANGSVDDPATFSIKFFNDSAAGNAVLDGNTDDNLFIIDGGDNTIVNYGGEDTIRFAVVDSSINGDDVVLTNAVGDHLIVKNAKGHTLKVQPSEGASTSDALYGGYFSNSPQDVIKTFMQSLNNTKLAGIGAVNEAINAASDGEYSTANALIAQMTLDARNHGADNFLKDDCGIILDNADTGAIIGWDAGGSEVKTAESIVEEHGAMQNFSGNSFTVDGVTFMLEDDFNSLNATQQQIFRGLYSWWAKASLDLIKQSYGSEFSFDEGDVKSAAKTITVNFTNAGTALAFVTSSDIYEDTSDDITLTINTRYYSSIASDNVNGESTFETAGYLDRTLAHELTHAIMSATINDFHGLPAYIKEGMAELTHGIDDDRYGDIEELAENPSYIPYVLTSSINNVNPFGNINAPSYAAGYLMLRYMAKKFSTFNTSSGGNTPGLIENDDDNTTVNGTSGNDTIVNRGSRVTINGGKGDDTINARGSDQVIQYSAGDGDDLIYGFASDSTLVLTDRAAYQTLSSGADVLVSVGSGTVRLKEAVGKTINIRGTYSAPNVFINDEADRIVFASSGNDTIVNRGDGATIFAGNGDDTIVNRGSNVTINGGKGDDTINVLGSDQVIQYSAGDGDDLILDFDSNDTISILDGSSYSTMVNGADVIISLDNGSVTLNNALDKSLNINGGSLINNVFENARSNIEIVGTDGDDTIVNRGSRVTINGGKGDDTINVLGSDQVIQYSAGDGDDLILDFDSNDTISILDGSSYSTMVAGNDVIISLDNESLTLNNAFDKSLNINGGSIIETLATPEGVTLNRSGKTLKIKNPFVGTIRAEDFGDKVKTINAASDKNAVELIGNDLDNVIKASKGGSTIEGGKGNDKITLGKGNDVIRYAEGDGDDVIKKFSVDDRIEITEGDLTGASVKGSNVILHVGDGSMTLKGALKKEITITDAEGVESKYVFTKRNNDLDSARIDSNAQQPAEYWFEHVEQASASPLDEIVSANDVGAIAIGDEKFSCQLSYRHCAMPNPVLSWAKFLPREARGCRTDSPC